MLILIAGPVRVDVEHIQLVLWGCHEADYFITNQVALLENASHYMAAARRLLPLGSQAGWFKIPNLCSWRGSCSCCRLPPGVLSGVWQLRRPCKLRCTLRAGFSVRATGIWLRTGSVTQAGIEDLLHFLEVFYLETRGTRRGSSSLLGELQHKALEQ